AEGARRGEGAEEVRGGAGARQGESEAEVAGRGLPPAHGGDTGVEVVGHVTGLQGGGGLDDGRGHEVVAVALPLAAEKLGEGEDVVHGGGAAHPGHLCV